MGTTNSDDALHRLVEAAKNDGARTARLLEEVFSVVDEIVAALVHDCEAFTEADRGRWRREIDGQVLSELISPPVLSLWAAAPARSWHFVNEQTHEFAPRAVDCAWIVKVADERDKRAERLLVQRVSALCDRAARRRGLSPVDADDARQEFRLWLWKDDCAALRRWSPAGGRSFDGWFMARAINQIDSWRRRSKLALVELNEAEANESVVAQEFQVIFTLHLRDLQGWVEQHCTPRQQEVFERWFLRQQSAAEIAAAVGSTAAAVNVTIARLRKAIKAAFEL